MQDAAQEGRTNIVDVILASGYPIDLTTAVMSKKRDLVKDMIEDDPSCVTNATGGTDLWGCVTPLGIAAGQGDVELVRLLLKAGADINKGSEMPDAIAPATPLSMAVWAGNTQVVEILLAHGARVEASAGGRKYYGDILDYAQKHSSPAIVRLLRGNNSPSWTLIVVACSVALVLTTALCLFWRRNRKGKPTEPCTPTE